MQIPSLSHQLLNFLSHDIIFFILVLYFLMHQLLFLNLVLHQLLRTWNENLIQKINIPEVFYFACTGIFTLNCTLILSFSYYSTDLKPLFRSYCIIKVRGDSLMVAIICWQRCCLNFWLLKFCVNMINKCSIFSSWKI